MAASVIGPRIDRKSHGSGSGRFRTGAKGSAALENKASLMSEVRGEK